MLRFFQHYALACLLATTAMANKDQLKPKGLRALRNSVVQGVRNAQTSASSSCHDATPLEVGAIPLEGKFTTSEGNWYTVVGTGSFLAASTCTGDKERDAAMLDTVIMVYSGDCDALELETYDDDSGMCGNLKSTAYFETVAGATYYVNVAPLGGYYEPDNNMFGLVITEPDESEIPPEVPSCQDAVPLAIDETAQFEAGTMSWFTVPGTGGYLAVNTCLADGISGDSYIEVYAGDCDDFNYVTYSSSYGSSGCSVAYFESEADTVYNIAVGAYIYTEESDTDAPNVSVTVSALTDIPNTICDGATPLVLGEAVDGETKMYGEMLWYTFVGTGGDLVISTCTGDASHDTSAFDSVIEVYARGCNDLRLIASDDEGGKCANGKSAVILSSVQGLEYNVAVREYNYNNGQFGIKVSEK